MTMLMLLAVLTGGPIDFAAVDRTIAKEPAYVGQAQYGLLLFGQKGETRVWFVLDQEKRGSKTYEVLYIDLDADGDLTDDGERFTAKPSYGRTIWKLGKFTQPGTKRVHTDFQVMWNSERVSVRMMWDGNKRTMGGYGPDSKSYLKLAPTKQDAPILVPGHDHPFQFERWYGGTMKRGESTEFKVFVGNRGDRTGAFFTTDDKFLPKEDYVVATLNYFREDGARVEVTYNLKQRC